MIHLLGLLKNPLFRMIGSKTIGMISHKLEKDKIIKAKENNNKKILSAVSRDFKKNNRNQ